MSQRRILRSASRLTGLGRARMRRVASTPSMRGIKIHEDDARTELAGLLDRLLDISCRPHFMAIHCSNFHQRCSRVGAISTTRMRLPSRSVGRYAASASGEAVDIVALEVENGSRTVKALPLTGPSLNAATDPPCIATSVRTSDKPMPRPPSARSSRECTWETISNTRSSDCCGIRSRCSGPR